MRPATATPTRLIAMFDSAMPLQLYLVGSFPQGLLAGLALNVLVALLAFAGSFCLGHALALGRLSRHRVVRLVCGAYVELVRAVPLLIVLFWFFFLIPILLQVTPSPLLTALIALTAYASAYQAEFIRSGIRQVAPGEIEAARSLGLSPLATWLRVVLPQAHRRMLPTYASYFTSLFKDTSVLYLVGLVDLMQTGLIAAERNPGRMLQAYATVGALFFIVCWLGSRLASGLERWLATSEHRPVASLPSATSPALLTRPTPSTPPRLSQETPHAHA